MTSETRARVEKIKACIVFDRAPVMLCVVAFLLGGHVWSQTTSEPDREGFAPIAATKPELNVSWLYGAYVPRDAPLSPLSLHQRQQLLYA